MRKGQKQSEEAKEKIRQSKLGKKHSELHNIHISYGMKKHHREINNQMSTEIQEISEKNLQ